MLLLLPHSPSVHVPMSNPEMETQNGKLGNLLRCSSGVFRVFQKRDKLLLVENLRAWARQEGGRVCLISVPLTLSMMVDGWG
jgi:hypothetical protein